MSRLSGSVLAALVCGIIALPTVSAGPAASATPALPAALVGTGSTTVRPAAPEPAPAGDRGEWTVTRVGDTTWTVSWRSPVRLPIGADRPTIERDGVPVGESTLGADGRTVEVTVTSDTAPDPAGLDVVLSGDRLDVAGHDLAAGPGTATVAPDQTPLAVDPGTPGDYPVRSSDYTLDPVKLAGMREPIEMVGHVVEPTASAATGPRPLVLFLHGRHSFCYVPGDPSADSSDWPCAGRYEEIPSHLGYRYIQRLLASQGFATVSIRVNGINAQDYRLEDGGAAARAAVVRRHLDYWATPQMVADHQVDLSRVVLVGHSRGGEGVDKASMTIPLDAPYRVVGQVLIAPTDFGTQTAAYVPTVTLLPYCDGDVSDLQGQRFTDTARDLTSGDGSLRSSVLVMGANHNFFNTEWTPGISQAPSWDDWGGAPGAACGTATPERLTAAEQRSVGKAYVAGAVRLFTQGDQQFLPMYDGSPVSVPSVGDAVVLSHAVGGGRILRKPGLGAWPAPATGAVTQLCRGVTDNPGSPDECGRGVRQYGATPHWPNVFEYLPARKEFEMSWTAAGQSGGLQFTRPLDLSGGRRLDLRTIVDPTLGDVRLQVRLTDDQGGSAVLTPVGGERLPALLRSPSLSKRWAQTLAVDPSPAAGTVDLTRVARVDLVGDSADGRVWVLDVASAPSTLPPVPQARLPLFELGSLTVVEGDGPTVAEVPFTVRGTLTDPARVRVLLGTWDSPKIAVRTVPLAAGQTSGSIPVDVPGDRLWSNSRPMAMLVAYPVKGVMPDDYQGRLTVTEDEPAPTMRVARLTRTAREGDRAAFRLRLSAPTATDVYAEVRFARGTGRPIQLRDVTSEWLRRHDFPLTPATTPVWKTRTTVYVKFRAGTTDAVFSVPLRRDRTSEPRETVSVKVRWLGSATVRTIVVPAS